MFAKYVTFTMATACVAVVQAKQATRALLDAGMYGEVSDAGYGDVMAGAYGEVEPETREEEEPETREEEEPERDGETTSAGTVIAGAVVAGVVAALAGVAGVVYRRRQAAASAPSEVSAV